MNHDADHAADHAAGGAHATDAASAGLPVAAAPLGGAAGATRQTSILFADIVGSTRLIRDLDPDDARDFIDQTVDLVRQSVHQFDGVVARVQGDGVMALFGAHAAIEDHAQRAALAALMMRDRVLSRGDSQQQPVQLRVGIHSGPILVRWIDGDFGRVLDAVGSTAHLAARVEHACTPGSVAISGATLDLLGRGAQARFISNNAKDESAERLPIFELAQFDPNMLGHAGGSRRMTPLVGRDPAVRQIIDLVRALAERRAGTLALVGDAGIGKSRLLAEAVGHAQQLGITIVSLRGTEIERSRPFGAVKPMLRQMLAAQVNAPRGERLARLAALGLDPAEADSLVSLLAPGDSNASDGAVVQPDERLRQIVSAARTVLRLNAARNPVLLLIDDVQYLDDASQQLVAELTRDAGDAAIGVIAGGRPESAAWLSAHFAAPLMLEPLDRDQTRALVQHVFAGNAAAEALFEQVLLDDIALRAGGLPLAIEEFASFAVRQSATPGAAGKMTLPARLENIFRSRIDQLFEAPRALCDLACVVGPHLSLTTLSRAAASLGSGVDAELQTLIDSGIIVVEASGRIRFAHQLFQEAGYQAIPRARRRTLHRAIHEALEASQNDLAISWQELARHAREAGMDEEALRHLWAATQEAIGLASHASVLVLYADARTIARRMGDAGRVSAGRFAMLAFDAAQQLAQQDILLEELAAICDGSITLSPEAALVARVHLALTDWMSGRSKQALVNARIASDTIGPDGPIPLASYAEFGLASIEFVNGLPRAAYDRLLALIARLGPKHATSRFGATISVPGILSRAFAGWFGTDLGEFAEAHRLAGEANALAEQLDHDYSRLVALLARGYLAYREGRAADAMTLLSEARYYCIANKYHGLEAMSSAWLALAMLDRGRILQAQEILSATLAAGHYQRVLGRCGYYLHEARARLYAALGEDDMAVGLAQEASAQAAAQDDHVHALFGEILLHELLIDQQRAMPDAHDALTGARARAERLGMTPAMARIDALLTAVAAV